MEYAAVGLRGARHARPSAAQRETKCGCLACRGMNFERRRASIREAVQAAHPVTGGTDRDAFRQQLIALRAEIRAETHLLKQQMALGL